MKNKKYLQIGLGIAMAVLYLFVSTYIFLCFRVSIRYDLFGFSFSSDDYELLHILEMVFLFAIAISVLFIAFLFYKNKSIITSRLIVVIALSSLALIDVLFVLLSMIIDRSLVEIGEHGFLRQFFCFTFPTVLVYNILCLVVYLGGYHLIGKKSLNKE